MKKAKFFINESKMSILLISFMITMVGLAIVGGFKHYSSIPFWDMWGGSLGFILKLDNGDYTSWWAQHNEHRVVLARFLFWIDYKIFGGVSIFLIIANYIIVLTAVCLYWLIFKNLSIGINTRQHGIYLWLFITGWLFLWTQKENLTWGFQSQFFLAQLLPLCALYWLAKSAQSFSAIDFLIACVLGVLSAGTMANGILALPLMFVYSLFVRQGFIKSLLLLILAIILVSAYFYGYQASEHRGDLWDALVNDPIGLLHYTMLYLGSPFYYLFGKGVLGKFTATLGGIFLATSTILIALKQTTESKRSALVVALVFFIAYIGGTAFVTAVGRLELGLEQALSSRYTTPSIMAWAALMVIVWESHNFQTRRAVEIIPLLGVFVGVSMLIYQIKALKPMDDVFSAREVAALALALGIKDSEYIGKIYPSAEHVLQISKSAIDKGYSIFGKYPYVGLNKKIGARYEFGNHPRCLGSLDGVESIESVADYVRVHGWLLNASSSTSPKLIKFVNQQGRVVGFGLTGTPRDNMAKIVDPDAGISGFRGYIQTFATGVPIIAVGDAPSCQLNFNVPPVFIRLSKLTKENNQSLLPTIPISNVILNAGFSGSDFQKTKYENLKVLGSHINADSNKGAIKFIAKKGDRFFYRSGPTGGRQLLNVVNRNMSTILPVTLEWASIELSGLDLPDKFEVKLIDEGDGWGEWSAIALANK